MGGPRGDSLIYNGLVKECKGLDSSLFFAAESYYEVVRVIDGKPVFLEDHIIRLKGSVKAGSRIMLMKSDKIKEAVTKLIVITSIKEGNIKISFNFEEENDYSLICFIEALYPANELYEKGIDAILFKAERETPAIKLYNYHLRSQIYDKLVRTGAYEALLVNSDNQITEGSKSNVFFIKDQSIATAPEGMVLSGITRKYVLELCRENNLRVELRCLSLEELAGVDSVFITGTSPKVLPVKSLADYKFDVRNQKLRFLMQAYNDLIDKNLAE